MIFSNPLLSDVKKDTSLQVMTECFYNKRHRLETNARGDVI